MDLIPAVDVLDGNVVRLMRGDYDAVTVYDDDPVMCAQRWVSQGAVRVHVVDLEAARSGRPDDALWRSLGDAGVPFQVGGGIRTVEAAKRAIACGADAVVMGTAAVWDPGLVTSVCDAVGPDQVIAALDVHGGRATGAGWRDEGRWLATVVSEIADAGVVRVLATGIGRDGTMEGPDLGVVSEIQTVAPHLAIQGSGGVGTMDDLGRFADAGTESAIVGRALYEGRFTVADALRWLAARTVEPTDV